MGIQLFWDDDAQTVLLMEIRGSWAWDELYNAMQTVKRISSERGRTFNAILDISGGLEFPQGGIFSREGLQQFRKLTQMDGGAKRGKMVILGMTPFIRRIVETAGTLDNKSTRSLYFADTMAQAQRIAYEVES
jgi:hypothetical protein